MIGGFVPERSSGWHTFPLPKIGSAKVREEAVQPPPEYWLPTATKAPPWALARAVRVERRKVVVSCILLDRISGVTGRWVG
jgi:hypothetical protein